MSKATELVALFRQVRHTTSPLERLRMLGRAGKGLFSLSRHERLLLARELGVDGAEHLVGLLARKSGEEPPEELLQLLERAGEADPEEVEDMLDGLRSGDREQLSQVLTAAAQWAGTAEAPSAPEADVPLTPDTPAIAQDVENVVGIGEQAGGQTEVSDTIAEEAVVEVSDTIAPVVLVSDTIAGVEEVREDLGREPTVFRRLRMLSRRSPELEGSTLEELRCILDLFPEAWEKRRALESLLRADVAGNLEQKLALIQELDLSHHRLWILSSLARDPDLYGVRREEALSLLDEDAEMKARLDRRLRRWATRCVRAG